MSLSSPHLDSTLVVGHLQGLQEQKCKRDDDPQEKIHALDAFNRAYRKPDVVKHPAHYTQGKIQVWDFITDQDLCYLAGCVVKYVSRYRHKGTPLLDLKKAQAYIGRLIEKEKSKAA